MSNNSNPLSSKILNPIGKGNGDFLQALSDSIAPGLLEKRDNGKWYGGFGNHWSDEALGAINGRNDARKAQQIANENLDITEQNAELDAANEMVRKKAQDEAASQAAQGLLNNPKLKTTTPQTISDPSTVTAASTRPVTPLGKSTPDLSSDFLGI